MNEQLKKFIEDNIELIENNDWEKVYDKIFPTGFTDTLLECDINPLELGLNYIPDRFLNNSKIKNFVIPNNIRKIGEWAFHWCINLTSITIPDSVTSIGDYAFYDCSNLTSIIIPDSVTSIGEWAFSGCSSLTSIEISNNVTSIGGYAFRDCHSLTEIKYIGTKEEALTKLEVKNKEWRKGSAIQKIICTDGEIEL